MPSEEKLLFGPYGLDPANARLSREGEALTLSPKSFSVLCHLVRRAGRLVGKDELLDAVWGHRYVSEGVLKLYVSELRSALGDDPKAPRYIETVHRRGYRFIAPVRPLERSHRDREPRGEKILPASPLANARNDPAGFPDTPNERVLAESTAGWVPDGGGEGAGWPVGREAPFQALGRHWERALRGERQLVFVTGEPGLGKTTLVEAFVRQVPPGHPVARGQCVEQSGAGEAYLPLLEALGRICRDDGGAAALLRRYAPTWLAQMPWLIADQERAELQGAILGATRERMLREGVEFLEAWSLAAPLLLVLEDLHWSDGATVELLALIGRRQTAANLLILGTYRPAELALQNHPLQAMTQELRLHRLCGEVALELLGEADIAAYLGRRLPGRTLPEGLPRAIHRRTDGQPLFMVNVIDEGLSQGWLLESPEHLGGLVPENLRQFIEQRLARLTPAERRVLEAASVFGAGCNADAVAAACGEDLMATEDCCAGLARQGRFLRPADTPRHPERRAAGRYAFLHALYRDVLYHRIPPARRQHLHRRAGDFLETALKNRAPLFAPDLALHFEASREYPRAIHYLALAAGNAARRFANPEALAYLSRALDLIECLPEEDRAAPGITLLHRRAAVRRAMNDMGGAVGDLTEMLDQARGHGHPAWEIRALIDLSRAYYWIDRRRTLEMTAEAVERSRTLDDPVLKILAEATHAGWSFYLLGWRDDYAETCRQALAAARRANDPVFLNTRLSFHTMLEIYRSRYREADATAEEGVRLAESLGDGYLAMLIRYFQGWALVHLGEWGKASALLARSLEVAERNGAAIARRNFLVLQALLHCETLDFGEALRLCALVAPGLDEHPDLTSTCLFHLVSGKSCLGAGDPAGALSHLNAVSRLAEDRGLLMDWFFFLPFHQTFAEYWLVRGDREQARRHALRLRELAARPPERTYLALAHGLLARIALAGGDPEAAREHLSGALAAVEDGEVPLAARRVYALAEDLERRDGNEGGADEYRNRAAAILRELADSLGADGAGLRATFLAAQPVREMNVDAMR